MFYVEQCCRVGQHLNKYKYDMCLGHVRNTLDKPLSLLSNIVLASLSLLNHIEPVQRTFVCRLLSEHERMFDTCD